MYMIFSIIHKKINFVSDPIAVNTKYSGEPVDVSRQDMEVKAKVILIF
ncbi:MAG: hypothetical protein LBE11_03545 [Prevotellaceae bacterium]|nr:hypothetical protein [Prevotellaceae bacterium]